MSEPAAGLCRRCGREPRKPGQRWGKRCHAAYMRARRAGREPTADESARLQALADSIRTR